MPPVTQDTIRFALIAAFAVTGALLALFVLDSSERQAAQAALAAPPALSATGVPAADLPPDTATPADLPDAPVPTDQPVTGAPTPSGQDERAAATPDPSADVPAQPAPAARACERSNLLVDVERDLTIQSGPGGGSTVGVLRATSRYLGAPTRAWVQRVSPNGEWGLVDVPWAWPQRRGWVRISGLSKTRSPYTVKASLGERRLKVLRHCDVVMTAPMAIGASSSPSPKGRFYVTDLVSVPADQPQFGSFAFGISTIQPSPPPGWTGGNQMAIHGTNDPGSIGSAASAGCLRVSEGSLAKLRRYLRPGTPVLIQA